MGTFGAMGREHIRREILCGIFARSIRLDLHTNVPRFRNHLAVCRADHPTGADVTEEEHHRRTLKESFKPVVEELREQVHGGHDRWGQARRTETELLRKAFRSLRSGTTSNGILKGLRREIQARRRERQETQRAREDEEASEEASEDRRV